eukprot:CAMPEP_0184483042 /NCGR_PEP_ID=MMETSP0113_2-20130426/4651_1 /TAXON_ID=91329 /ORGANISM="Norrisiella sphaerica, Strain BC52" /LENGTH=296 /DNA_ID=CAMNT_0026863173 /DNA_START=61 /DNA_END=951 /DNA_ORIENTATION=-
MAHYQEIGSHDRQRKSLTVSLKPLLSLFGVVCAVGVLFVAIRSHTSSLGHGMRVGTTSTHLVAPMHSQIQRIAQPGSMCMRTTPSRESSIRRDTSMRVTEAPVEVESSAAATGDDEVEKDAYAHLRFIRGSPHKYRRVVDTIRGRSYEEALAILQFMPYRACENVLKVVRSAAANAAHNMDMKKSKLYISDIWVDEGPIMYRFKYRAQGRVNRIRKPTSHLFVRVKERQEGETGSKFFSRRRRRKEVGPNWKGQYIEDPVEIVADNVDFEEGAEEEVEVAETAAETVAPVEGEESS